MKSIRVILLILLLFLVLNIPAQAQNKQEILNCGIIITHMAVSPTAIMEGTKPLANYLGKKLGLTVKIEIITDVNIMINKLNNGEIELGYVGNLDYVKIKNKVDVSPFAKVVKGGNSNYTAILLVRNDSNIKTIDNLKGKSFAYTSENSAHGYLYPGILIKNKFKIPLQKFFGKIVKTKKDPDGILAVLYKQADAVSASSQTFAIMSELMPRLKRELKVISTSQPLVHGPMFVYSKNFKDKSYIERVKKEILNMGNSTEGKQVLLLFKIGGWTSATDNDYESIRSLLKNLGQ